MLKAETLWPESLPSTDPYLFIDPSLHYELVILFNCCEGKDLFLSLSNSLRLLTNICSFFLFFIIVGFVALTQRDCLASASQSARIKGM